MGRHGARIDDERLLHRHIGLVPFDVAVGGHPLEDPVAAGHRRLGLPEGMIVVRAFREGCEIGGLSQAQLVHGLVEVAQRGRGDAVVAHAEIDLVEIELEDAVLAEGLLDPEGEQDLLDLAAVGLLARQQQVLGDLLGDRRGALRAARVAGEVGEQGASDALWIDAAVLVEVPVFRRQEGGDDPLRHSRQRKVQPVLARVFGDDPAVGGMQARRHRGLVARELRVIRQVGGEMPEQGSDGQRSADQDE